MRRAQWKALGLTDADMQKPKIAVVNSSSELAICFSHLDGIAKVVKEAIRAAGGLPFEVRTAAPSDFIISAGGSGGYILASRDLIVNDMEIAVEGAQLDGMICLSSCDKTPPAHLMAAGPLQHPDDPRDLRLPAERRTTRASTSTSRTCSWARCRRRSASSSKETLRGDVRQRDPRPRRLRRHGAPPTRCTSSCEALGMALPGSAPVLANSPKMFDAARRSGRRIVEMVLGGPEAARTS